MKEPFLRMEEIVNIKKQSEILHFCEALTELQLYE